jgi:putative membrane protein insertion efficiency factor
MSALAHKSPLARAAALPFLAAIYAYRFTLGPLLAGNCRFHPSCSQYALDAYREHNPLRATWLTARRLLRCHPLVKGGYDPVPFRAEGRKPSACCPNTPENSPTH